MQLTEDEKITLGNFINKITDTQSYLPYLIFLQSCRKPCLVHGI